MTTALPAWLQFAWAFAGIISVVGGVCWLLLVAWPYLRWTRRTMEETLGIGRSSAQILETIKADVVPLIADAKSVVGSIRTLVDDVKNQNPGKILEFLDKLSKDGTVERMTTAVEIIGKKVQSVFGAKHEGERVEVPDFEEDEGEPSKDVQGVPAGEGVVRPEERPDGAVR